MLSERAIKGSRYEYINSSYDCPLFENSASRTSTHSSAINKRIEVSKNQM